MTGIFKRIARARAWVKILDCYHANDVQGAIAIYQKNFNAHGAKSHHLALYATLLVLEKRHREAEKYFELSIKKNENEQYIEYYCKYYLSLIRDESTSDVLKNKALQSKTSTRLRRWLPLSH